MTNGSPYNPAAEAKMVLDSIRRIVQMLRQGAASAQRELGISAAQLFVLEKLTAAKRPVSVGELAERTLTHQSSVSVVVQRLEDAGLVVRARSQSDARRVELLPTQRAIHLLRKAPTAGQDRIVQAVTKMPARQRKQLAQLLAALAREVAGEGAPAMLFEENHPMQKRSR